MVHLEKQTKGLPVSNSQLFFYSDINIFMKQAFSNVFAAIFLLAVCAGCQKTTTEQGSGGSGSGSGSGSTAPIATITINITGDLSKVGNTAKATAVLKDAAGNVLTGRGNVTWASNKISLNISPDGNITTSAPGLVEITATLAGVTGKTSVQVGPVQSPLSIALSCNCDPAEFPTTPVSFTHPIMKAEDLAYILPLGYMFKGHVTPISHQYYFPPDVTLGAAAPEKPIYSPADGYIVRVTRTGETQAESSNAPRDGYAIYIQHSCTIYSDISLITSLPADISSAIGVINRGQTKDVKIKVTAGQVVARVGGQGADIVAFDQNVAMKQLVVPEHYTEVGKKYKTDPFLLYTDAIKAQLFAKTIRTVEPKGGRFDYDIDGKLVGSWFLQGTNGFAGAAGQGNDYWRGHMTFAYNAMDPAKICISIGRWFKAGATDEQVKAGWQFMVTGNTPDPKDVGMANGMVKYEVTNFDYVLVNNPAMNWDNQTYQGPITPRNTTVEGVVLVQLIENRILKVESFPGKTAAQVTGFSTNAQLFER